MAGSPRIIARPTTRPPAACRRARVRQGQAFGGAEEAPSLTAAARDGDANMRSGRENACGEGRTKEWNDKGRQKWVDASLTNKAPYKPYARIGPVRICAGGARWWRSIIRDKNDPCIPCVTPMRPSVYMK